MREYKIGDKVKIRHDLENVVWDLYGGIPINGDTDGMTQYADNTLEILEIHKSFEDDPYVKAGNLYTMKEDSRWRWQAFMFEDAVEITEDAIKSYAELFGGSECHDS